MRKITVPQPCTKYLNNLNPIEGGYMCTGCNKKVTDYSNMTDAELLACIKKGPLGCGEFKPQQLDRPLNTRRKIIFLPLLLITLFFTAPTSAQIKDSTKVIDDDTATTRRFGTGNVCVIKPSSRMIVRYYNRVSIFWGLIKFKYPIRKPNKKKV